MINTRNDKKLTIKWKETCECLDDNTASTASNVYEEMPSLSVEIISQPGEKESTLLEIKHFLIE